MAKNKSKKDGLSERQEGILRHIYDSMQDTGRPPTIRELCKAADISSTSVANYNLQKLEKNGYIKRDAEVSRGIRLSEQALAWLAGMGNAVQEAASPLVAAAQNLASRFISVPLVGTIAAGTPIIVPGNAYDYDDAVEVSRSMIADDKELFALRVKGDSMIDAMVSDGDIVIMKKQQLARNGEMVAVWLTDEESTTLKYFYHDGDKVRLQPANPTMQPIYANPETVQIQGRVVMVMRQTA
ncbi:MAG: transcriptional repressor LexA [Anaerolineae bacterium]|nr:transcriptional repressor LexA [Anaerolineae bacterium]